MKKALKICICSLLFMQLAILTGCRAKHTIQFIVDNEEYYTIKTKGKEEISMPEDPTKSGYIFDGWYFDEGVWNEPLTKSTFLNQKLKHDAKVYAKFLQEDIITDEAKAYVELYIDGVLYKTLVVDKENYTLPTTDNNGNDNLIWFSESNKIYTDSTGKGIETLESTNKLYVRIINTIDKLESIKNNPTSAYVLTTDIDLGEIEWTPIDFSGVFYGNHHAIKNFKITKMNSSDNYGLFGKNTGIIRDLGVEDFEIIVQSINDVSDYAGGLVGYNYGTISNSYASGNVTATGDYINVCVGGLVGYNDEGSISNSYATGNVASTSVASPGFAHVGGLVGKNYSGTINNSYATGNVTATSHNDAPAGGLVGENFSGTINNSYAFGNVSATAYSKASVGGLVGNNWDGTINNSYAFGNVSATSSDYNPDAYAPAGGLVGENSSSTINNSYRYSGQIIKSSTNDINTEGVAKSMGEITSVSFYTNTLG